MPLGTRPATLFQKMNTTTYPQEIKAGAATIRVTSPAQFWIDDSTDDGRGPDDFTTFGPYDVESTADLSTVSAVLQNPAWDEDQITAAVEALNPGALDGAESQRRREWRKRMAAERNWDNGSAALALVKVDA